MFLFDDAPATTQLPAPISVPSTLGSEHDDYCQVAEIADMVGESMDPTGVLLTTEDISVISNALGEDINLPGMVLDTPSIRAYATSITFEAVNKVMAAAAIKAEIYTDTQLGLALGRLENLITEDRSLNTLAIELREDINNRSDVGTLTFKLPINKVPHLETLETVDLERLKVRTMTEPMGDALATAFFESAGGGVPGSALAHPIREHIEAMESDSAYESLLKTYGEGAGPRPLRASPEFMGRSVTVTYNPEFINKGGTLVSTQVVELPTPESNTSSSVKKPEIIAMLDRIAVPIDLSAEQIRLKQIHTMARAVIKQYTDESNSVPVRRTLGAAKDIAAMSIELIYQTALSRHMVHQQTVTTIHDAIHS